MSPLTITAERAATDLMPGDRILAIDDYVLSQPREVRDPHAEVGGHVVVALVNDLGTGTEWNIYPDNVETLTFERPDPAEPLAARSPRVATRHFGPLTLRETPNIGWATADRRHGVSHEAAGLTECESPHPVRITSQMRAEAERSPHAGWAQEILRAVRAGKRGYYCPGQVEHPGPMAWIPWSEDPDVDAIVGPTPHAKFREAADEVLAAAIEQTT